VTFLFAQNTSETVIGFLVAFSGGTFLHVAADDLLPEVHRHGEDRNLRLFVFILGLLVIWAVTFLE
jgi:zinc transporter ZupT